MPHFKCCGIDFDGEQAYLDHRRQIHGEQPTVKHTCCGIKFFTHEGYFEHRQTVHGDSGVPARRGFLARLLRRP